MSADQHPPKRLRIAPISVSQCNSQARSTFSINADCIQMVLTSIDFDSNHPLFVITPATKESRTNLIERIVQQVLFDHRALSNPLIECYIDLIRLHDSSFQESKSQHININLPSPPVDTTTMTDQSLKSKAQTWNFYKSISDDPFVARIAQVFHLPLFRTLGDKWNDLWFVNNLLKGSFYNIDHQTVSFTTRRQREVTRDQIKTSDAFQSEINSICNVSTSRLFVEISFNNHTLNRIKAASYHITRAVTLVRLSLFVETINNMYMELIKYQLVSFNLTTLRDRTEIRQALSVVVSLNQFVETIRTQCKKFRGISYQGIINIFQVFEDETIVDDNWWNIRWEACTKPLILVQNNDQMMHFRHHYAELLESSDQGWTPHAMNLFENEMDQPD